MSLDRVQLRVVGSVAGVILVSTLFPGVLQAAPSFDGSRDLARAGKAPQFSGSPPRWVQRPYLGTKRGGGLVLRGSVLVDPVVIRPDRSGRTDKLTVQLLIAKSGSSTPKKPRALEFLPDGKLELKKNKAGYVSKRGVRRFEFVLPRKVSKSLGKRSFAGKVATIAVSVTHLKDVYLGGRPRYGVRQWNGASLAGRPLTRQEARNRIRDLKRQLRIDRGKKPAPFSGNSRSQWNGTSPMFNTISMTNSTPFTQQLSINPNIQCMWTGDSTSATLGASIGNVAPGTTVSATYEFDGTPTNSEWAGLQGATGGLNAPGTQGGLTRDLVGAATAAGQNLLTSAETGGNYNEAGAVEAAASAAVTFLTSFFEGLNEVSTCNDVATYPETFAVTSTVTGFGTNGSQDVSAATWPVPSTWNVTPPPNLPGAWSGGPLQVGTQVDTSFANSTPPTCSSPTAAPTDWCGFVYGSLQPMLGAQTSSTYYWNGGQPAYMVSNNAQAGTNTGGGATFQGGLFQNFGPNPGTPGDAWCKSSLGVWSNCSADLDSEGSEYPYFQNYNPVGSLFGQLTYLSNPDWTTGIAVDDGPELTVQRVSQGGDAKLQLTCKLPTDTQLNLPFGPGNATYSTDLGTAVGASAGANGSWLVSYFAVNPDNEFVYDPESLPSDATGEPFEPDVGPGSNPQTAALGQGNVQATIPAGIQYETLAGQSSSVSDWGCTATPSATFPGLAITQPAGTGTSGIFGTTTDSSGNLVTTGWPMPGNHTGWPNTLFTPYDSDTNYSWQWPVDRVNVGFQGVTQPSALSPNPG